MNNTQPPVAESIPTNQQPTMGQDICHPERDVVYAVGVVLLLFGTAITGHHQASLVGLAMIVICNLI